MYVKRRTALAKQQEAGLSKVLTLSSLRAYRIATDKDTLRACLRLKEEEKGKERLYLKPCETIIKELRDLGGYLRPPFLSTADTDYDVIVPRGNQQAHFRLRKVTAYACLVTSHVEPRDPLWHARCGLEDQLFGEKDKSAVCISFYRDPEETIKILEGKITKE